MTYEDFEKFVREQCAYETMYYDSNGRLMLIINMLEAYMMVNKVDHQKHINLHISFGEVLDKMEEKNT